MRQITKIIIHCTGNRPNCKMKPSDFMRHQVNTGLGYHYIIFEDGTIFRQNPIDRVANHCRGHNANSIGIAYVGGYDENGITADTRTPAQKSSLNALLIALEQRFHVPIYGHRHFNNGKVCPCFNADSEYASLRQTANGKPTK